ncbi:cytochrome P450 [Sorangium sp. So ce1335]|uniref:cytochrome P450 n=1 Tax=Sorangium sp. So ce1335 TaxID=3133335 RepID=UPI003F643AFF
MSAAAPLRAVRAYDLRDPALLRDPHPLLHRMRDEEPVYWSPQLESWVLTSYQDVCAALRDPRLSVVEELKRIEGLPTSDQRALGPLRRIFLAWGDRADPERHALFIKLLKRHFTPQHVEAQRPRIQALLDGLLDAAAQRGEMDLVNDVAHPMAMGVVAGMTGLPTDAVDLYLRCSNKISQLLEMGDREQLFICQEGMIELSEFLRPLVARRRREPGADLLGVFLEADPDGAHFSDEYIVAQCIMFLVVGYHTTANQLCNGVQILFDHAEERARLARDRALLPNAFDEMMRYHGAVASVRRMATVDLAIRDKHIRAGETLVLALAAANRDPQAFPAPDRFDPAREGAGRQVGFTIGPYSCMGQALARLEAQVFFSTLFDRFPRLRPRDAAPDLVLFRPLGQELRTLRVLFD